MEKAAFFAKAVPAAISSGHVWPLYAVCEAALESAWGESQLCKEANNLFGEKQGEITAHFETVSIRTHEVFSAEYINKLEHYVWKYGPPKPRPDGKFDCTVDAVWPKFPDWEWSFRIRMTVLDRMPSTYGVALGARTGEDFIREVSKHWATDPERADKVLATYRANWSALQDASILAHKAAMG
jgi:flagellum-specific peptidoglycan hydrolase FlgJ